MATYQDKLKGVQLLPEIIKHGLIPELERLKITPERIRDAQMEPVTIYYEVSMGDFKTLFGKLKPCANGEGSLKVLMTHRNKTYREGIDWLNGLVTEGKVRVYNKVDIGLYDKTEPLAIYVYTGAWEPKQ